MRTLPLERPPWEAWIRMPLYTPALGINEIASICKSAADYIVTIFNCQNIICHITTNIGAIPIGAAPGAFNTSIEDLVNRYKDKDYISYDGFSLTIQTAPHPQNHTIFEYKCDDGVTGIFARFAINDTSICEHLASVIANTTTVSTKSIAAASKSISESEYTAYKLREATTADLNIQFKNFTKLLQTITARDIEQKTQLVNDLELRYAARQDKLNQQHEEKLREVQEREEHAKNAIDAKEQTLAKRMADFELRESKALRREAQKHLEAFLESIKGESGSISKEATEKRTPVFRSIAVLAAAFFGLSIYTGYNYFSSLDLHYGLPFSGSLIALTSTLVFYMRWSNQWFRLHAENELNARRYKADMIRAAWIAEFVQECASEGKEPPRDLLEVFSKSLFQQQNQYSDVEHPLEQVMSLMKRAGKIDIAKGRIAIETTDTRRE